jgi:hypothetical protein
VIASRCESTCLFYSALFQKIRATLYAKAKDGRVGFLARKPTQYPRILFSNWLLYAYISRLRCNDPVDTAQFANG